MIVDTLRSLLKMVMSWQTHRLSIRHGEEELAQLKQARAVADLEIVERAESWQVMNSFATSLSEPEQAPLLAPYPEAETYLQAVERGEAHPCAPADQAIQDIRTIRRVDFVEADG